MNLGKLIVCGNQIGNLFDLPAKTIEHIKMLDNIICDTRDRFLNEIINPLKIDISNKTIIPFEPELNNTDKIIDFVINKTYAGEDVVFICDAGMPGISDWGTQLVKEVQDKNIDVELIPGPSIITAALAIAGIPAKTEKLFYAGFMDSSNDEIEATLAATTLLSPCLVLIDHPEHMGEVIRLVGKIYNDPQVALCINLTMPSQQILRGSATEIRKKYLELTDWDCFMTLVVDGS